MRPHAEQVRGGLWSVPVPIPGSPLHYVFVYVLESNAGLFLVDAGWSAEESWVALTDGLASVGAAISDVTGVLVTHLHPDHYGLASRIHEASGACVGMHPADAIRLKGRYGEGAEAAADAVFEGFRRAGATTEEVNAQRAENLRFLAKIPYLEPDVLLDDGDRPDIPGWDLVSLWTPGHSPGHLTFYEQTRRLMFAGDHVLPRITPNVSMLFDEGKNSLGAFIASLKSVRDYPVVEALPGHEGRFIDFAGRVDELLAHHEGRLVEVRDVVYAGADTAWEVAMRLHWSRPWDTFDLIGRQFALGETLAHLVELAARGLVYEESGVPCRWRLGPG